VKPGRLSRLILDPDLPLMLRGEIWVSPEVLSEGGFDQGPEGLVHFASSLKSSICFFHWPESGMISELRGLVELAHSANLDCGLTVNGPFQRLSQTRNLLEVLQEVGRDPSSFQHLLAQEKEEILATMDLVGDSGPDLIMITEDVGYTGGLYFSPEIFREGLVPFYRDLMARFSSNRIAAGWHSDGDVGPLLPDVVRCGFRFFSLEPECIDLLKFKKTYGSRVSLISGIRAAWLTTKDFDEEQRLECLRELSALTREGGMILSSSCGLHSPKLLPNLRQIYLLAECLA
jgi:hypothetical protein